MRLAKQITFGFIFLLIAGFFSWFVYVNFIQPPPSCFDNKKNQNETGVDCGGPCTPCEIKYLKEIQVSQGWPKWFKTADSASGIIAEIYNPNPDWAAVSFSYQFDIKDQFGSLLKTVSGNSFIYGGELKYLIEPVVNVDLKKITSVDLKISNPKWVSINDFKKPEVEIQDIKTEKKDMLYVSGKAVNRSEFDFKNTIVYALVYNKNGEFLAASRTIIDSLDKFSSSNFKISFGSSLDLYQPITQTFSFKRTLKVGDSGEDVGVLQSFLLEGGFLNRDPINYFDEATQKALSSMQEAMGLPSTGDFDEATLEALNSIIASAIPEITKLQETQSVDPTSTKVFLEVKK